MAAATSISHHRGSQQFQGVFSDLWAVTCTLDTGSLATGASGNDTVTVPGVKLGDVVLAMSNTVASSATRVATVTNDNEVTITTSNLTGAAVDPTVATVKLVVGRFAF